jgi:hypothetical protein
VYHRKWEEDQIYFTTLQGHLLSEPNLTDTATKLHFGKIHALELQSKHTVLAAFSSDFPICPQDSSCFTVTCHERLDVCTQTFLLPDHRFQAVASQTL